MDIIGKIYEFTPIESGTSQNGDWSRCQVIIITLEQNPAYVAFTVIGRRIDKVNQFVLGDVVRIKFRMSSRKVNDRWFNDNQLWEIMKV